MQVDKGLLYSLLEITFAVKCKRRNIIGYIEKPHEKLQYNNEGEVLRGEQHQRHPVPHWFELFLPHKTDIFKPWFWTKALPERES